VSSPPPAGAPEPLHVRGVVLPDAEHSDLWVVAGRVTYEPTPTAHTVATGWVVPGLVDAHCHIGLGPRGGVDRHTVERQALEERDSGVLLARDCGVPVDTRWVDDRADLPRIVRAGRHVARTRRYLRDFAVEVEPEQLPEAVAEQAGRGDGWVKIVGDWIDRDGGDLAPCWPAPVLVEAVRRAHAGGARVSAHVFGEEALPDLLAAGIDCVEHGTGLSRDLLAAMAESGTALVPTLVNIDSFPGIAAAAEAKFPTYAAHMRRLHASARGTVRTAYEAGVRVFAGSDAGSAQPHGLVPQEVRELAAAGLPAADALAAGSWAARDWLGRPCLQEGAPADLVVYAEDPRADLRILRTPARVILRGRVVA